MRHLRTAFLLLSTGLFGIMLFSTPALAGSYSQLQVLLPGETEAPGTITGKLGTPETQTAGVPFIIVVRACDDSWNTVTSVTNAVQVTSTDESATLPNPTSLADGQVSLMVTLNAAGSFTISAEDQSDETIPQATSSSVTSMALQGFEFSRINQKNQYAGVPMYVSLMAVDPNGQVVTGFSGAVHLKQITSYGEGRISPNIVTLTDGTWSGSVTMYRADETSINRGNVNIMAYLAIDPSKNGISDPFTIHPGPFSHVQIIVPGQEPLPGSVSGFTGTPATQAAAQNFDVDIYATDDYWNPVPSSDVVRITSSDPGASTPVSGSLNEGFRRFSVSLGTVGSQTLTVTDQTNSSIDGMTSPPIPVIPSAADHFEIDDIPSPVVAGNPIGVTIRATDAGGNTIPDYSGDAILSANTGPGSISPEAITFTDGVWTSQMVFRGAGGAVTFTCSDFSAPPHMGISNSFEVLPGTYTKLQLLLPGETPQGGTMDGVSGTPTDQNAGSSFSLTVRAVDQYWNRVQGISSRIALSSTDAFASMPAETTLNNGELILPVTLYKTGSQTITAEDLDSTDIVSHTSSAVHVISGPYARILILAPGEELAPGTEEGRAGTPTDQSINFAFTVTVYATDNWWNPVTGVNDMIRLTSGDPMAELPTDTPLVDGRVDLVVRLSTGGYQQITVTNLSRPDMPPSTTQVRMISSGFHLEAEVSHTMVQAGGPFILTVKVTNDAGSVIQEINSIVTVKVQNASTEEPGCGTLLTTQFQLIQGQRSVSETYTFAEPIVLIARDDAGNDPAVTEVITVIPGAPAAVTLSCDPPWVGGNKHATVAALVDDAYGNGVPDQPVLFLLLSGNGALTPLDSLTAVDGVARADFLSPRVPEIARVRASSGGLVDEIDIETALVDPTAPGGTVTNYPNPFHPSEASTTIAYKLADDAAVSLIIYTLTGDLVLREDFAQGSPGGMVGLNEFAWDGRNGKGDFVSSGGYILVIEANSEGETLHVMGRKLAVVR
jgi:hypothetical protein